jgi:hypothetical protein
MIFFHAHEEALLTLVLSFTLPDNGHNGRRKAVGFFG